MNIVQEIRNGVYDFVSGSILTQKGIKITQEISRQGPDKFYVTKDGKTYCLNNCLHTGEIICVQDEWNSCVSKAKQQRFEIERKLVEDMFK